VTGQDQQGIQIRPVQLSDAEALINILAPYITQATVNFDDSVPALKDFQAKITRITAAYPFLVALAQGTPVGYCYADRFRGQTAYDWAVETTIYLDAHWQGRGIGRRLYQALEEALKRQHVLKLYACISAAHSQSVAFHHQLGYQETARFRNVGYKMGEWLDILWMEKQLGPLPEKPLPFLPCKSLDMSEKPAKRAVPLASG